MQIGKRGERLLIGEPKGDPTAPWRVVAHRLHYAAKKREERTRNVIVMYEVVGNALASLYAV